MNVCERAHLLSLTRQPSMLGKKSKPDHSDWMKKCTRCDHALYLMQIRTSAPFDWLLPLLLRPTQFWASAHVLLKKRETHTNLARDSIQEKCLPRAAVLRSRAAQYPQQIATRQSFTAFTQSCLNKLPGDENAHSILYGCSNKCRLYICNLIRGSSSAFNNVLFLGWLLVNFRVLFGKFWKNSGDRLYWILQKQKIKTNFFC